MHAENGWKDIEKGILSSSTSAVLLIHNIFQTTGLTGYQVVPTAREVISFGLRIALQDIVYYRCCVDSIPRLYLCYKAFQKKHLIVIRQNK